MSHLATQQDFAAKVLCDNLIAIATLVARKTHAVPLQRRTNRAYARTVIKPLIPALLLGRASVDILRNALKLIASQTFKYRPGLSKPRPPRPNPNQAMSLKPC